MVVMLDCKLSVVCFLLGNSPASEFYMPTFRNTLSDAGELPRRKHTTYRTRRNFEIQNVNCLFIQQCSNSIVWFVCQWRHIHPFKRFGCSTL